MGCIRALIRVSSFCGIILIIGALLYILIDYVRILRLRQKMPPGPFPMPLFGNFFAIPKVKPWFKFEEWAKQYDNPLTTIWNGHRPIIMCNDCWTVSDLLEKRASIYSSRPHMIVMGDMLNATETNQTCQVYGDRWRLHRKLTHSVTGTHSLPTHRPIQSAESKILTSDLLDRPASYVLAIERYACSIVSIIGWGRRIDRMNDYVAQCALAVMEGVDMIIPGLYLMEAIPFLTKLPAWMYALPTKLLATSAHMQRYFYALSEEGAGTENDNFAKRLLREKERSGLVEGDVASLTANLIGGGVDTTSSSLITFVLAMCVFQDAQKKAQEELDATVGRDRSPDWSDEVALPYVAALVKEVLRWRTTTILGGIPHAPTRDDYYRGYLIPKGAAITGNVWAIHRHPRDFPEPDEFRPERFLDGEQSEGWKREYPNKKGHNAFGWGRRVCSGMPLAEQGLWGTVVRLLWAFEIRPGLDETGKEVKLDIFAYTKSENMRPEPFKARFIPRTGKIEEIIRQEARIAREELRVYDGETKLTMENVP